MPQGAGCTMDADCTMTALPVQPGGLAAAHSSPALSETSSLTSSEGERQVEEAQLVEGADAGAGELQPTAKVVKTVDARVSALKALAGIGTVVSKSRKVDAEALQQIKEQRAKAKAGQHHTAVASALAGAPGAPASDPSQPRAAQQPRSVSLDGGPSAARHISVPAAALAAAGGGSGYGLPPADTAAVAAAALAAAGGIGAYPVPQPQLQLQQGYPSSPAASPPGVGTLSPCGSAQLGPLLRPMRSLPANFSPQLAGASMPPHPFAQQHQGGGGGGGGVQQGGMDAAAAAALPPPFAELLPSLSVQELLSLKSAVEALLLQHAATLASQQQPSSQPQAFNELQQQHQQQQAAAAAAALQQRAEQAALELQQAQRAQQASAILQSLSAAAASGGPFAATTPFHAAAAGPFAGQQAAPISGPPPGLPHSKSEPLPRPTAYQMLQQRPTPFCSSIKEEGLSFGLGADSVSPITSLDGGGHESGRSLSPTTSACLPGGLGDSGAAEQHLLGESLSSFLDTGGSGMGYGLGGSIGSAALAGHDPALTSCDGPLFRSISMPTGPLLNTARSASLSSYLGATGSEPATDVTFLFSSLQVDHQAQPESPQMLMGPAGLGQPRGSGGSAGMGLPPTPRAGPGGYRSVRFHERGKGYAAVPHANLQPPNNF